MKVQAYRCPRCNEILYSRANHDFRYCPCDNMFVDGGQQSPRCGWMQGHPAEKMEIEVKADIHQLYDDWNYAHDKFGRISNTDIQTPDNGPSVDSSVVFHNELPQTPKLNAELPTPNSWLVFTFFGYCVFSGSVLAIFGLPLFWDTFGDLWGTILWLPLFFVLLVFNNCLESKLKRLNPSKQER